MRTSMVRCKISAKVRYSPIDRGQELASVIECLQSLTFRNMYARGSGKERATGSGEWVFKHDRYLAWQSEGGILWVRGRAGCGKSMLLDHIISEEQKLDPEGDKAFVMWFFFRRAGEELQRSAGGLFRLLLHQMLNHDAGLLSRFRLETNFGHRYSKMGRPGNRWGWTESELRDCFDRCIRQAFPNDVRARIFVDAIGESGEEVATSLLSCFQKVLADTQGRVSICISSRPYPIVNDKDYLAIDLEKENGGDMRAFMVDKFAPAAKRKSETETDIIMARLVAQASGCFQWLSWILQTRMVGLVLRGESIAYIMKRINGYPTELGDVYEGVLHDIDPTELEVAFRLFEWITLAIRPLSVGELRYAVCLDTNNQYHSIAELEDDDSDHWCTSEDLLVRRAADMSHGLIRTVAVGSSTPGGFASQRELRYTLPFDHQSVSDFMTERGLQVLWSRLSKPSATISMADRHLWIAKNCLNFLMTDQVVRFGRSMAWRPKAGQTLLHEYERDAQEAEPPLALYAAEHWSEHVRIAERDNSRTEPVLSLLVRFPAQSWPHIALMQKLAVHSYCLGQREGMSLIHVVCSEGLVKTLNVLLTPAEERNEYENTVLGPLRHASSQQICMETDAGQTPLSIAAEHGHCEIIDHLLRKGAQAHCNETGRQTPLHFAARGGHEKVVQLLLAREDVNVDAKDANGRNALFDAVIKEKVPVVQLLLPRSRYGVHSREVASEGLGPGVVVSTPLNNAWLSGSTAMLKILMTCNKIDSNLQDMFGFSMLHHVSGPLLMKTFRPSVEKTQLLIESGKLALDPKNQDGQTPLAMAAERGAADVVRLLLASNKVDIQAKDKNGHTPLLLAIGRGHPGVVKLLLDTGKACLTDNDVDGNPPLVIAVQVGRFDTVRLLISTGHVSVKDSGADGIPAVRLADILRRRTDRKDERMGIFEFLVRMGLAPGLWAS